MLTISDDIAQALAKRIKIVNKTEEENSLALQKSDVTSLSNTITSLHNAFNVLIATTTNSLKIEKLQQSKDAEAVKEASMEASVTASSSGLGGVGNNNELIESVFKALPQLTKTIDELTKEFGNLDLSPPADMTSISDIIPSRGNLLKKAGTYAAAAAGTVAVGAIGYSMLSGETDEPTTEEIPVVEEIIQQPPEQENKTQKVAEQVHDITKESEPPKPPRPLVEKSERVQTKLVESARKAAGPVGVPVKRGSPTSMPNASSAKSWAERLSSFIGKTVSNVTSYVSSLPERLSSLAGSVGGAISSFGSGVANTIGDITAAVSSGGGAADMEQAIERAGIKDPVIKAQIMAQAAHESMNFTRTTEMGNERYFQRYEGRKDLGNVQPGDGPRYRGRGFLQTTGRANYAEASKALGVDFVNNPDLLSRPEYAAASAMLWFKKRWGKVKDWGDTRSVTRLVNGGYNGLAEREANFAKYLKMYKGGGTVTSGLSGYVQGARQTVGRGVQAVRETASTFVDNVKDVAGSFMNFFTLQPSVDMSGMKQPMVRRLKAMGAEYNQKTGKKIIVASAFRSRAKQEQLYNLYRSGRGNPAAPPGTSKHESGLAIDLDRSQADWLESTGMLAKYGLHRPDKRASERQHVEPIEGSRLASVPDNPYTPGKPIATVGKGTQPVALGNGATKPIPKAKPIGAASTNVAVMQKTKGQKSTTTIVVASNGGNAPSRTTSYITGKAAPHNKTNRNNSNSYLAYFGIG